MSQFSRRSFLKVSVITGSGLILGCITPASNTKDASDSQAGNLNPHIQISPDNIVTIFAPRPDCGQGVKTALPMIIAEELGCDWKAIKVVQAPANRAAFGNQSVGGSGSVRGSFGAFRVIGATAALMLRQAAAQKWGVPIESTSVENGFVIANEKKLSFGELALDASKLPVPERSVVQLKDPQQFRIIGKPTHRVDSKDIATGQAKFGIDTRIDGMHIAMLARPTEFGAQLESFDEAAAKKVVGVKSVLRMGDRVAVVAISTWSAMSGVKALNAKWTPGTNHTFDSEVLTKRFKDSINPAPAPPENSKSIESTYSLPFLSHAPLEPMNCTAHVKDGACEIWVPTQVPDGAQDQAARQLGIPMDSVELNVTMVGGGFGRRLSTEYVNEAVEISKATGLPIQLLWSREDDLRHDHYRPATFHKLSGSVGSDGMPNSYSHQCVQASGRMRKSAPDAWTDARLSYAIPNAKQQFSDAESPVPIGAWRSVENTYMNFVQEAFFDELCELGGQDPVKARLQMIKNARLRATLEACAGFANWGSPLGANMGRGVACFAGYGSYITQIAEVSFIDGILKIIKVTAVIDCGLAVNPLGVEAQVMGATMDAIATLLHSQITIKNGGVEQSRLSEFGWAHIDDAPEIEVHFIQGGPDPGGIGEVGYPAAGPAVLNAISKATGKRFRDLPIMDSLLE